MSDQIRSALDGLSATDATSIALLSNEAWSRVSSEATRLLAVAFAGQIKPEDVASEKETLLSQLQRADVAERAQLAVALAQPFVRANVRWTRPRQRRLAGGCRAVEPLILTVQYGQVIVRDGDPVTKDDIEGSTISGC